MRTILAVLALLCVAPTAAPGQTAHEGSPERFYRVGVGVGGGSGGVAIGIDATLDRVSRLYKARLSTHDNVVGSWSLEDRTRVTVTELGLMYGQGRRLGRAYGTVAGGLGLITIDEDDRFRSTVGIPVEGQLVAGGRLKVAASLLGNLNAKEPLAALLLSVQFGRVP